MWKESKAQEPAGLRAFIAGTSPVAREILRKLVFGLEQRLTAHQEPLEQAVPWLENRLQTFWALQPEFTLLLSRLWGGEHHQWMRTSPRELAILLVLGTSHELDMKRDKSTTVSGP